MLPLAGWAHLKPIVVQEQSELGTMLKKPFPGMVPTREVAKSVLEAIGPTVLGKRTYKLLRFSIEEKGKCWIVTGYPDNPTGEVADFRPAIFTIRKSDASTSLKIE